MSQTNDQAWKEEMEFVRGLDILSVIEGEVGKLTPSGPDFTCICPFHNDRKIGNFKVPPSRNRFHCFACGEGGDSIDFIQKLYGYSLNDAVRYISNRFGYAADESAPAPAARITRSDRNKPVKKKGSPSTLNSVYEAFYQASDRLTPRLKRYLSEERKLDVSQMRDFFTFPNWHDEKFWYSFERNLRARNLDLSTLLMVPGFYIRTPKNGKPEDGCYSFVGYRDSYGMLCRNMDGQIVGIQIGFYKKKEEEQADEKKGKPKYLWFSSGGIEDKGWGICGTPSGAPYDICFPEGESKFHSIVITEGKYKALAFAKKGMTAINIHGVSNLRNLKNQVAALDQRLGRPHTLLIGLDADMMENGGVAAAAKQVAGFFADSHKVYVAYWDKALGKGFDDLVNNGNYGEIKKMLAKTFIPAYVDPLLKKEQQEKDRFWKETKGKQQKA